MQIEVPPDVRAKGPGAIAEFWQGAYMMRRILDTEAVGSSVDIADVPELAHIDWPNLYEPDAPSWPRWIIDRPTWAIKMDDRRN